jgi:hypothetical protein
MTILPVLARQWLAIAVALLLANSALAADESAPVPKPEVRAGDRWTLLRTNFLKNVAEYTYETRVTFVGPDVIVTTARRQDTGQEFEEHYTSEWNAMAFRGTIFTPHTGTAKFPLRVGASHKHTYEYQVQGSQAYGRYESETKVVGWEDIVVPAGKFRALKLEKEGWYTRLDIRGTGWQRLELWYVPEVKRFVKFTLRIGKGAPTSPDVWYGEELVEFSIQ